MVTRVQKIREDEVNSLRGRVQELETLFADACIQRQQAMRRTVELEQAYADLARRLDAAESGLRYAIGETLDDSWVLDHARAKAGEAADLLISRCREVILRREMSHWQHDTGCDIYDRAPDILSWMMDQHDRFKTSSLHRGRELLHLIQALGYVHAIPEAMGMLMALRDLDALQMVEESRSRRSPNNCEIAAAIREGEVA